jgi:hypothetical protein
MRFEKDSRLEIEFIMGLDAAKVANGAGLY